MRTAIASRDLGPDSPRQLDPRKRAVLLEQIDGIIAGAALASVGPIYIFGSSFAALFCLCAVLSFALRPVWAAKALTESSWLLVLCLLSAGA